MQQQPFFLSRALLAVNGEHRGTATWQLKNGVWYCCSASFYLRWMRGMENFETVKRQLKELGFSWNWIVPVANPNPVKPPFQP